MFLKIDQVQIPLIKNFVNCESSWLDRSRGASIFPSPHPMPDHLSFSPNYVQPRHKKQTTQQTWLRIRYGDNYFEISCMSNHHIDKYFFLFLDLRSHIFKIIWFRLLLLWRLSLIDMWKPSSICTILLFVFISIPTVPRLKFWLNKQNIYILCIQLLYIWVYTRHLFKYYVTNVSVIFLET